MLILLISIDYEKSANPSESIILVFYILNSAYKDLTRLYSSWYRKALLGTDFVTLIL
jgi:hypothetical protein